MGNSVKISSKSYAIAYNNILSNLYTNFHFSNRKMLVLLFGARNYGAMWEANSPFSHATHKIIQSVVAIRKSRDMVRFTTQ